MTAAELKAQIALATRALAVAGIFDHNGHISVRDGDVIYINGRQNSRLAATAASLATVRIADGKVLEGGPPSETPLHLGVYRARADVGSVAHFHPLVATAFAVAGRPLITAFNAGAVFGPVVPVFDDPDLVRTDAVGAQVAKALGDRRAVLLRGHGALVAGIDIPECLTLAIHLEENARRVAQAVALGEPRAFTTDEVDRVHKSLWQRSVIEKTWTDSLERARRAGALDGLVP